MPIDPADLEVGEKKYSRAGFANMGEAYDALDAALKKRKNDEQFHGATPTLEKYGRDWG